jgi:DNA repair exonuclease SbcCD ATPase subunit
MILALVVGIAGFWIGRATFQTGGDQTRIAQLEAENAALKASLEKLGVPIPAPPQSTDTARTPARPAPRTPVHQEPARIDDTELRILRDSLAAARQSISEWQARVGQLETQLEQTSADQKRLAGIESDLSQQLASQKQLAEAKDSDLSRRNERLAQLEAENKKLNGDVSAAGQKASELQKSSDELQAIYRRRESALNVLINRYKEVTEQYRALASVLENRRGPEGAAGTAISIAGPELGRIQNTITLAEEDLRQLNALNAQALRLQKKIAGK